MAIRKIRAINKQMIFFSTRVKNKDALRAPPDRLGPAHLHGGKYSIDRRFKLVPGEQLCVGQSGDTGQNSDDCHHHEDFHESKAGTALRPSRSYLPSVSDCLKRRVFLRENRLGTILNRRCLLHSPPRTMQDQLKIQWHRAESSSPEVDVKTTIFAYEFFIKPKYVLFLCHALGDWIEFPERLKFLEILVMQTRFLFPHLMLLILLAACGGGDSNDGNIDTQQRSIGGKIQVSPLAALEAEPNQTLASAQSVQEGSRVSGEVADDDPWFTVTNDSLLDVADLYRITVTDSLRATLLIAENDLVSNDLDLLLLDSNGALLDISEGLVARESIDITTPGTYLLGVRGFQGASSYLLYFDTTVLASGAAAIGSQFVPGELLVRYRTEASLNTVSAAGPPAPTADNRVHIFRWDQATATVSQTQSVRSTRKKHDRGRVNHHSRRMETTSRLAELASDPEIEYVEPNYLRQSFNLPNDQNYPYQWHYPLIKLPQAWDITTGDAQQVVAVIDTGVVNHPDLQSRLTDTGYDFISMTSISNDGDGIDSDPTDPGDDPEGQNSTFHGTHVAGTIGAVSNNNSGVSGVTWQGGIMPLRAIGVGGGTDYDIAQAIRYAAGLANDSGIVLDEYERASIVNLSLGDTAFSNTIADAVADARDSGVVLVAAAGNSSSTAPNYPAALPGVFSVGAVDLSLEKAPYSNFGVTLDLVAPGGNIEDDNNGDGYGDGVLSTGSDDDGQAGYLFFQGTSMAAPHVSGVFSLMLAANPDLSDDDLTLLLAGDHPATSRPLTNDLGEPGKDQVFGYGLIDAAQAVRAAQDVANLSQSDEPLLHIDPVFLDFGSRTKSLQVQISNLGGGEIYLLDAVSSVSWLQVSQTSGSLPLNLSLQIDRSNLSPGEYSGELTIMTDSSGSLDIHISMAVVETGQGNVGTLYILLIDAETEESISTVATDVTDKYRYTTFAPPGRYYLVAGTDLDNDDYICDIEDACGFYPNLVLVPSEDGELTGLDFDVQYLLQPQGKQSILESEGLKISDQTGKRKVTR